MKRFLKFILIALVLVIATSVSAIGDVPATISYQGILTTNTGSPVSGSVDVAFEIFTAPTGGSALWTETRTIDPDSTGLFTVILGNLTPIPDSAFKLPTRWLGITVESQQLSERIALTSSPFSYRVSTVDGSTGGTVFGDLIVDGELTVQVSSGGTSRVRDPGGNIAEYGPRSTSFVNSVGDTTTRIGAEGLFVYGESTNEIIVSLTAGDSSASFGPGNQATGANSFVAGASNTASGTNSAIGGGTLNYVPANDAVVAGGQSDTADGFQSSIGGGSKNRASGALSHVGGGESNRATSVGAVVAGGLRNLAYNRSFVGGGEYDSASGQASCVAGGENNTAGGDHAVIGGGFSHRAMGAYSVIGGGNDNTITGPGSNAVIVGGLANSCQQSGAFIGGGDNNIATTVGAVIAGGSENVADGGDRPAIGGGYSNRASGNDIAIAGGAHNEAIANNCVIAGGLSNTASGPSSAIGGGEQNQALAAHATVPGGSLNTAAAEKSFAAGYRAKAVGSGSFVWADYNPHDFQSTAPNQFIVRATGGVEFVTGIDGGGLAINGASLPPGGGGWSIYSDRNVKHEIESVDVEAILDAVSRLDIQEWSYLSQPDSVRHIGPMAQDFYSAFGVGEDERHISTIDADGVALAAIQALWLQNQELASRLARVERELRDIRSRR